MKMTFQRTLLLVPLALIACSAGKQGEAQTQEILEGPSAPEVLVPAEPRPVTVTQPAPISPEPKPLAAVYSNAQLTGLAGFSDMVTTLPTQLAPDCAAARALRPKRRLRAEVLGKVRDMALALCRETGERLWLESDHRSASEQLKIWRDHAGNPAQLARERGCKLPAAGAARRQAIALCILKYNSMPGTSRHHWGTDIDLNSTENAYWSTPRGRKLKAWLDKNAARFGFCQVYAPNADGTPRKGYKDEAWHWSYTPFAAQMLAEYEARVTDKDIMTALGGASSGVQADDIAALNIRRDYVGGIADTCRNWKS